MAGSGSARSLLDLAQGFGHSKAHAWKLLWPRFGVKWSFASGRPIKKLQRPQQDMEIDQQQNGFEHSKLAYSSSGITTQLILKKKNEVDYCSWYMGVTPEFDAIGQTYDFNRCITWPGQGWPRRQNRILFIRAWIFEPNAKKSTEHGAMLENQAEARPSVFTNNDLWLAPTTNWCFIPKRLWIEGVSTQKNRAETNKATCMLGAWLIMKPK